MAVEIKVPTIDGLTLNTKNKYVEDDIVVTIDKSLFDNVFELYKGDFIAINPNEELLPNGFSKLNFIESTGEQYIDTEYNMTTVSSIELVMAITEYDASNKMGFLGSYESNSTLYQLYASGTGNQSFYMSFGGKNYAQIQKFNTNVNYEIIMKADTASINSSTYNFTSDGLTDAKIPLYLFWRNATGAKAKMRLFSCNIYNNGILERKFIPCIRMSDNAIGLYDLAKNKFYENKGTGVFIGG